VRIILKLIIERYCGVVWPGLIWLRIEISAGWGCLVNKIIKVRDP
jgi:hypothetical protein